MSGEIIKEHDTETKYVIYSNTSFGDTIHQNYNLSKFGYGKNAVKVLYIKRDGALHTIRECEVDVRLRLSSKDDYLSGDNSHIIATDSQKNTVYVLARKYGVSVKTVINFKYLLADPAMLRYC
ncbi:urate oxidase [Lycorma delicatula]|uniref:urate oxidase n=1 Tax=Lycorma delicatula TaxID=130591 RepID=UPI003F513331